MKKTIAKENKTNIFSIDGVNCIDLVKQYKTPLYVFDEQRIIDTVNCFKNSLKEFYGDGLICYASKAFCCKKMYRLLSQLDIGADAVSGGELFTAKSSGFDFNKLVFHGNNKSFEELELAISSNIFLIVIDSIEEAKDIDLLAKKYNITQNVLIRVNPSIEAHTHHFIQTSKIDSKFGFSINNGDALDIIKNVLKLKNISLKGLHCHIGSQIFEKKSFILAVEKMTSFYKAIKDELNLNFDMLNLGGGFGINYNDKDPQFSPNDYCEYVKAISNSLLENIKKYNLNKPFLILEPGRSIVGEAGVTFYTVGNIKEIKGIKNYASIDGGMFENPRFALYSAIYTVIAPEKLEEEKNTTYTIAGKCCESGDIIAENCLLPKLDKGDILAVLSTGAYNYSMASNYNRNLIPAVVFVKNGKSELVVKRQTYEDITKFDI